MIIEHRWLSVAGALAESYIARNHRLVYPALEVFVYFLGNLMQSVGVVFGVMLLMLGLRTGTKCRDPICVGI